MGGLEGRAYYPSGGSQARLNSQMRYYQKYIKPIENKNVNVARIGAGALGVAIGGAMGERNPFELLNKYEQGQQIFDIIDKSSENAEAYRMRNNAPGDLSGKAVWSHSKY